MDFGLKKKIKTIQPDKSDFSTQKKKPDTSDFANKQKPKKIDTSKIKNTFESDAGVKPRVTTFTADTNAAKSTNKDRSDFAGGNKNKNKIVPSLKISSAGTDEAKGDNKKAKKLSFLDKIKADTKKNFSGDYKNKTGRYKSISTGKTNFNKKK